MRVILASVLIAGTLMLGCSHAPPTLTPQATTAFYGSRVIQALDLVRDTAIAANAQTPPLLTLGATRSVVRWHESALVVVHLAPEGWKATVVATLDQVLAGLPTDQAVRLSPYAGLLKAVLKEEVQ